MLPAPKADAAGAGDENADGFGDVAEPPKIDPPEEAAPLNGLLDVPNPDCV